MIHPTTGIPKFESVDVYCLVMRLRNIPRWLTIVYEVLGSEMGNLCEQVDDDIEETSRKNARFYYEVEVPKVMQVISEWTAEMSDFAEERKKARKKELEELLEGAKQKLAKMLEHRGDVEKKKALLENVRHLEALVDGTMLTPEQVARAKEYPIERLIEVNRGMARCVAHDDTHPSMNCKNNFVFCYSCGYHDDVIGLYMRLHNVNFAEAVRSLLT